MRAHGRHAPAHAITTRCQPARRRWRQYNRASPTARHHLQSPRCTSSSGRQRRWGICRPTCIPMISMCFGANVDSLEVAALEIPEVFDGQHVDQLPVSVMSRGEEVAPHPDGNRAERVTPAERCRWVEPKLARCAPKPLLRGGSTPRAHSRERLGSRACFIEKRRIYLAKWVSGGSGRLGGGHVDKQPVLGNGWE